MITTKRKLTVTQEIQRIQTLLDYEVMDTESEEDLEQITELASRICNCPITLISLLDDKRQWFKARVGLDAKETPKDIAFCKYTIEEDELFSVENALNDDRFKSNPLVTGAPNIRFYAGMPLRAPNGFNIGTLCVIDTKPRELNEDQKISLAILSKTIIKHLELKIKNRNLKTAIEYANKCSKAKDDFLSNMSHELRTPLNAIYGFTEMLSKTQLNKEQQDMLSIVRTSGEILLTLINDILDFSKIESGKVVLEECPFDLKDTIVNVHSLLKPKCEQKNVGFNCNIDSIGSYIMLGDKVRITQIIINLVGNAIKFTSKGKVSINIKHISETKANASFLFSVTDTGIGIPENMLSKIFERFEQASTDTVRKFGGTGLGLSISKSLVELLGGELKIKSKLGQGSEFYFEITLKKPTEDEISSFSKENQCNVQETYNFKHIRVLVCEDNPINIKLISKVLSNEGIKFDIAENGKLGIELIKKHKYDIVLMDLQMPEMDGFETTKYIRSNNIEIPIMAMTANCSESEKIECLKIGMNEYLSKPYKNFDLFSKMAKLLQIQKEDTKSKQGICITKAPTPRKYVKSLKIKCTNLNFSTTKTPADSLKTTLNKNNHSTTNLHVPFPYSSTKIKHQNKILLSNTTSGKMNHSKDQSTKVHNISSSNNKISLTFNNYQINNCNLQFIDEIPLATIRNKPIKFYYLKNPMIF